tara:strand:- start:404 stop:781 length:378 start_codon:yes stop_codon:yes gene_type:complete
MSNSMIQTQASDLAIQIAGLRSPTRLRAIQHCLQGPQTSASATPDNTNATQQTPAAMPNPRPHSRRRSNHRSDQTSVLVSWFEAHKVDPYPSTQEKIELGKMTGMDVKQIENWFTNRRKRNWRHE